MPAFSKIKPQGTLISFALLWGIFAYAPASLAFDYQVKASSSYQAGGQVFGSDKIKDGLLNTAWQAKQGGIGVDEWIELKFAYPIRVQGLLLTNGHARLQGTMSQALFEQTNRIRQATIVFSDGHRQIITLKDTPYPQWVDIHSWQAVTGFRLIINQVYLGKTQERPGLSEVEVYSVDIRTEAAKQGYYIDLGGYVSKDGAQSQFKYWQSLGFAPQIMAVKTCKNLNRDSYLIPFRLVLGPFANVLQANQGLDYVQGIQGRYDYRYFPCK